MRTINTTVSILLAVALSCAATAAWAGGPLQVGISAEPYPPFTYKTADGEWTGFEVEIAQAICDAMQRECVTTPTAWSGIIPALNSGKIDMIIGSMSITKRRDRMVDFSHPYYKTGYAFVAPKSMDADIPKGLAGKIVGVQSATLAAKYTRRKLRGTGVEIRYYPKQEQLNRDLLAQRVDLMVADSVAMYQFVQRDSASAYEVKTVVPSTSEGVAVVLRPGDDKLRHAVNKAIASILADGTCKSLSMKYFGANICAGK